jgi:hypothetical protein
VKNKNNPHPQAITHNPPPAVLCCGPLCPPPFPAPAWSLDGPGLSIARAAMQLPWLRRRVHPSVTLPTGLGSLAFSPGTPGGWDTNRPEGQIASTRPAVRTRHPTRRQTHRRQTARRETTDRRARDRRPRRAKHPATNFFLTARRTVSVWDSSPGVPAPTAETRIDATSRQSPTWQHAGKGVAFFLPAGPDNRPAVAADSRGLRTWIGGGRRARMTAPFQDVPPASGVVGVVAHDPRAVASPHP